MRNLHLIILQEFGIEARRLLREWERLQLRFSDYKNHRIFSLRCIHKELIPVSIKLKTTLDTPRARHIIRKAEKDLLQARIKAINNILEQVDRESQDCRDKLASIISQERLEQCQDFINKVSELRFNKVKQRQINKLNHLVTKKEGNITSNSNNITLNRLVQSPPNARNPTPAMALLPPGEGDNSPPATGHPPPEGNSSLNNNLASNSNSNTINNSVNSINPVNQVSNQTISQVSSHNQTPAIAHLPPGEGSNSPPVAVQLPSEANSSPPQLLNQANNQTISQGPPHLPTPGIAHLPPREGSSSLPGAAQLPSEANSSPPPLLNQANNQTVQLPAIAHLPPGEGSNSPPGAVQLHSEANSSPPHPPQPRSSTAREENNSSQASNNPYRASQAGHNSNPPRANRQGTRLSPRLQTTQPSPEACATSREGPPSSTPPHRSSQGSSNEEPNPKWVINLSNKPLTPVQRSVLAKGPNFVVTPQAAS